MGIDPTRVTAISPFGHLIVSDRSGAYWYLDPELRTLEQVADCDTELFTYMNQPEVRQTWQASALVEQAFAHLGESAAGWCYSLKPLALLGGDYNPENLCILPVEELVRFSGSVEEQTRHLPEGASFRLKVVD